MALRVVTRKLGPTMLKMRLNFNGGICEQRHLEIDVLKKDVPTKLKWLKEKWTYANTSPLLCPPSYACAQWQPWAALSASVT